MSSTEPDPHSDTNLHLAGDGSQMAEHQAPIASTTAVVLAEPSLLNLAGFEEALARGWSPDPGRQQEKAYVDAELEGLRKGKAGFLTRFIRGCRCHVGVQSRASTSCPPAILDLGRRILRLHHTSSSAGNSPVATSCTGSCGLLDRPVETAQGICHASASALAANCCESGL